MPVSSIKKKTPISGNPFPGCLHHFPTGLSQASWRRRLWVANSWVLANFSGSPSLLGDFRSYRLLTAQTSESKIIWWFGMWRECGPRRVQKAPEWVEGERGGPPHLPAPFPWCPLSPDVSQASVCFISIGEQLSSACEVWVFDPGPKSKSVFITLDKEIRHPYEDKSIYWTFNLYFSGSRTVSGGHTIILKDQGLPRPMLCILASP